MPGATVLRVVRAAVAALVVVALAAQFVQGRRDNGLQAENFFSYFTVLSNCAAAVVLAVLAARPSLASAPRFAVARGAVTLYMVVTALVYAALLAPASADVGLTEPWVDAVVHEVAPVLVLLDWLIDPPGRRLSLRQVATWLIFPAVYLVYSLVRGPIADWYPYPFLDPDHSTGGYALVGITSAGILVTVIVLAALLRLRDGPSLVA
jgi:hypothetical protein